MLTPEWKILIDRETWKNQNGHIRVNFEERIVSGEVGPSSQKPSLGWMVFAKIYAPFDGLEIRDWFYLHLEELEEVRESVLKNGQENAHHIVVDLVGWIRDIVPLLPGEWKLFIEDRVFDDVDPSQCLGFVDVDYRNREVTAYTLVGEHGRRGDEDVVLFATINNPIDGRDLREWFESRIQSGDLENARRKKLVHGSSSFQSSFPVDDFRRVFTSPAEWMSYTVKTVASVHNVAKDLLSMDLRDFIESESPWSVARFDPSDLVDAATALICGAIRSHVKRAHGIEIDRFEQVEGDEVLKILDEPYLFLQIWPEEPQEGERKDYEQGVEDLADEMLNLSSKDLISIQMSDDGLLYVQISLPWKA